MAFYLSPNTTQIMTNNRLDFYLRQNRLFARSVVVKHTITALAKNRWVRNKLGYASVDDEDPTGWIYYLHIAGQYHPADDEMSVVSLDDGSIIPFEKTTLAYHPNTLANYQYGTRLYEELLKRYPHQCDLIFGIIHPADLMESIQAREGSILSYASQYIKPYEYTLVAYLQEQLYTFLDRWSNDQYYATHHDLPVVWQAGVMAYVLQLMLVSRLERANSSEVHEFHIAQYLSSFHGIDQYMEMLTREQQLYLYRNIQSLVNNAGEQRTAKELLESLFAKSSLPVYEYVMKHDVRKINDALEPAIVFERTGANSQASPIARYFSAQDVNSLLWSQTPQNKAYIDLHIESDRIKDVDHFDNKRHNRIYHSHVVDYGDFVPRSVEEVAITHWLAGAQSGYFNVTMSLQLPQNSNVINLTPTESAGLFVYAMMKLAGRDELMLPEFKLTGIYRFDDLDSSRLREFLSLSQLSEADYDALASLYEPLFAASTADEHYANAKAISDLALELKLITGCMDDADRHAYLKLASEFYFSEQLCLEGGFDVAQLLQDKAIATQNYTTQDWVNLSLVLFEAATHYTTNRPVKLKDIQNAMMQIFKKICSYSLTFISTCVEENVVLLELATQRWRPTRVRQAISADVVLGSPNDFHISYSPGSANLNGYETQSVLGITYQQEVHIPAGYMGNDTQVMRARDPNFMVSFPTENYFLTESPVLIV
jgi:hypothetical protein